MGLALLVLVAALAATALTIAVRAARNGVADERSAEELTTRIARQRRRTAETNESQRTR